MTLCSYVVCVIVLVNVLQNLREAWNWTPDLDMNLAGWSGSQKAPCDIAALRDTGVRNLEYVANCTAWRGVECMHLPNETSGNFYIRIISL